MISNNAAFALGFIVNWYFGVKLDYQRFMNEAPTANDVAIRFAKHELRNGEIRIEITVQPRPDKIDPFRSMDTVKSEDAEAYVQAVRALLAEKNHADIPFIEVKIAQDDWR
jgi:ribosomal protein S12 methylthiotransferase accessory factor YcaO